VWRTGRDDGIYGTVNEFFVKKPDRGFHPEFSRIRNEQVSPDPNSQPLFFGRSLILREKSGIDPVTFTHSHKSLVEHVRFPDAAFHHHRLLRYILLQGWIIHRCLRIGRGIDDRLPIMPGQVLGKFYPALYPGSSTGGPVIGYDQDLSQKIKEIV
jgi:hypothetical protein